jgi:hypothetical protein
MKTAVLIDLLARGEQPIDRHALLRRVLIAMIFGAVGALALFTIRLGINPGLADLLVVPAFWIKTGFTALTFIAALAVVTRLARPGAAVGRAGPLVALPALVIWILMAITLVRADPDARLPLLLGATWRTCPMNIVILSLPIFLAGVWALRGLAPTNLRAAGAAAGLTAGALGAVIYGLHCPELASPFLGTWYVIGMTLPALMGAWLGPRLLRW